MMLHKNLPKWIFASVCEHFKARKDGKHLFIEGDDRDTKDLASFLELRVDGPHSKIVSKGYYRFYVEINLLVSTVMNDVSIHDFYNDIGIANMAFTRSIEVFKLGDPADTANDESHIGCLVQVSGYRGRESVQTNNFGQIDVDTKIQQATVECHYEMYLTIGDI